MPSGGVLVGTNSVEVLGLAQRYHCLSDQKFTKLRLLELAGINQYLFHTAFSIVLGITCIEDSIQCADFN
jgi:hypothetical protein